MHLIDTTVLSNFAFVDQVDLLFLALPDFAITPQVMSELQSKPSVWHHWVNHSNDLVVISLSPTEEKNFEHLRQFIGSGEASCLAVLLEREGSMFSDDRRARRYAKHLGIPASGTIGVLLLLHTVQNITVEEVNSLLNEMIEHGYYSPVKSLDEVLNIG